MSQVDQRHKMEQQNVDALIDEWLNILNDKEYMQKGLYSLLKNAPTKADATKLVQQLQLADKTCHGGLKTYVKNAKRLLKDSRENVNPFDGYAIDVPDFREKVAVGGDDFMEYETLGINELPYCCFVLVAGGLGERLGYPDIKISLPVEITTETTYIQHYISYIIEYQKIALQSTGQNIRIPLAIMTSDDTHNWTVKLLKDNKCFGLKDSQVYILKQHKVPSLKNNEAELAISVQDPYMLEWKPHGHGDVHSLLASHGLTTKWVDEGKKWVIFFQDTNSLACQSFPCALGVSARKGLVMNSIGIPRKPGEAIGAICKLTHRANQTSITINVEYNQLSGLLTDEKVEMVDRDGYSYLPGNTNILIFALSRYADVLEKSGGSLVEFVNPKYKDDSRTAFATPTRLECMMQDFPKLLETKDNVGVTELDRWFCFSTVKNSISTAMTKAKANVALECAMSGEADHYASAVKLLSLAAKRNNCTVSIGKGIPRTFDHITYDMGPRVLIKPSWAISLLQIQRRMTPHSNLTLSSNSTLILDGDIQLNGLDLNGTLLLRARDGGSIKVENLKVKNKGWELVDFHHDSKIPGANKYRIRGFILMKKEQVTEIATQGEKILNGTRE